MLNLGNSRVTRTSPAKISLTKLLDIFVFQTQRDINSPWLQPGVGVIPSNLGFSPYLKIRAVAKAKTRGGLHDPQAKAQCH